MSSSAGDPESFDAAVSRAKACVTSVVGVEDVGLELWLGLELGLKTSDYDYDERPEDDNQRDGRKFCFSFLHRNDAKKQLRSSRVSSGNGRQDGEAR